jgi:stage II sporulation protein M
MSYKRWILIAICLFVIGMVVGFIAPSSLASLAAEDIAALEELAGFLATLPPFAVLIIIFIKNVSALVISFIFSPILCLFPIMALVVNGWLLAFVSAAVVQERSLGFVLAALLPHGVFELPAIIIGEAAALSFGAMAIVALFSKGRRNQLLPNLKQNLRYLGIACALLLPAAIIETYITPLFLT